MASDAQRRTPFDKVDGVAEARSSPAGDLFFGRTEPGISRRHVHLDREYFRCRPMSADP